MDCQNNKIKYKDVMRLGFNREDNPDKIWYDIHGFSYFIVNLDIGKINFDWDIHTHKVTMNEIDDDYYIIRSKEMTGFEDLKDVIAIVQKSHEKYNNLKNENETIYSSILNDFFNENREENTE